MNKHRLYAFTAWAQMSDEAVNEASSRTDKFIRKHDYRDARGETIWRMFVTVYKGDGGTWFCTIHLIGPDVNEEE